MNILEHILTCFAEEGLELAHQISKAKRFGLFEQRDLPTSNAERMQLEYNDLIAMSEILCEYVPGLDLHRDEELIKKKRQKFFKYLNYSDECGTLTHEEAKKEK